MQIRRKNRTEQKKILFLYPSQIKLAAKDTRDVSGLAESIRQNGLISPITVRRARSGFEVVCGSRRFRACLEAGIRKIPCVLSDADDCRAKMLSLTENLHYSEVDIFEFAERVNDIMRSFNLSYHETAGLLGMTQPKLCEMLSLLRFTPEQRRNFYKKETVSESAKQTENHPPEPKKSGTNDVRLFTNSLNRIVEAMRNAGFAAESVMSESQDGVEFTVRVSKTATPTALKLNA